MGNWSSTGHRQVLSEITGPICARQELPWQELDLAERAVRSAVVTTARKKTRDQIGSIIAALAASHR